VCVDGNNCLMETRNVFSDIAGDIHVLLLCSVAISVRNYLDMSLVFYITDGLKQFKEKLFKCRLTNNHCFWNRFESLYHKHIL